MSSTKKAISLYSGGLDSILAIVILLQAAKVKLEIIPVKFVTPFFNYRDEKQERRERDYLKEKFNVNLQIIDITDAFLEILDKPKYGYGKNLNPCIDCKILMLKKARDIMQKEKSSFVFTGEVIGQRPKSQKFDKMRLIEKQTELEGYLLRPLSAKLLKETLPEKENIINRNGLLSINGRSRDIQLSLAKDYDLKYFTTPSGGCLLTDPEYARKVKKLKEKLDLNSHILKFVRWGRIFLIKNKLLVVGRNDFENKKILKLAAKDDLLIQPKEIPGPLCAFLNGGKVIEDQFGEQYLTILASICAKFTIKKEYKLIQVQYDTKKKEMDKIENLKDLRLEKVCGIYPILDEHLMQYIV